MRHRLLMLALCGILVGAGNTARSADRYPASINRGVRAEKSQTSNSPDAHSPSPDSNMPNVKNYYRELFGHDNPRRSQATMAQPTAPASQASGILQAGYSQDESGVVTADAQFDEAATSESVGGAEPKGVVHAQYQQRRGNEDNHIQQVRAVEESVTTPADKSQNTVARKQSRMPAPAAQPKLDTPTAPAQVLNPFNPPTLEITTPSQPGTDTPHVTLNWVKQGEIVVGQECQCELVVANSSKIPVHQVVVNAYIPTSVRVLDAAPTPAASPDCLTWTFPLLAPGEERPLQIRMLPSRRGDMAITADVRFSGSTSTVFHVEEPMIKITVAGPKEVLIGDPASQIVTVSNPGTGTAHNVSVEAEIPKGLEHPRGERLIMEIGSLNPGESRMVRLALAAIDGGEQPVRVTAHASSDLSQSAIAVVNVVAPSIGVAIEGPALRYLGRNASYILTVTNDGGVPTNNVLVTHQIPEGFRFVKSDHGTQLDEASNSLRWYVGQLDPDEVAKVTVELSPSQLGEFVHHVQAVSEHGVKAISEVKTRIDGTSSLVLSLKDLDDPVEVAAATAYEIRLRNEGTKSATNVTVECELPESSEVIGVDGPTRPTADGRRLAFSPIAEVQPGQEITFRVHLRSTTDGNLRFRVRLSSDSIEQPLIAEEITKVYRD